MRRNYWSESLVHPATGLLMKNQNFDDLMASMGVRKLERSEPRKGLPGGASSKSRTKVRRLRNRWTQTSNQSADPDWGLQEAG